MVIITSSLVTGVLISLVSDLPHAAFIVGMIAFSLYRVIGPISAICSGFILLGWLLVQIQETRSSNPNSPTGPHYVIREKQDRSGTDILKAQCPKSGTMIRAIIKPPVVGILPGDTISFENQVRSLTAVRNPYEFDYASWLSNHGITHSIFLKGEDLSVMNSHLMNLSALAVTCQQMLRRRLALILPPSNVNGVIEAITFGVRNSLSDQHRTLFEETGTMHVMAVSGLHVGLIAGLLYYITGLPLIRRSRPLRGCLILFGIWSFVFITGLKPSGVRAANMFSFLFIAPILQRENQSLNTLFLAGFFMICWNIKVIFDIGFQLSFAAVLSIVLFYPFIQIPWTRYKLIAFLSPLIRVSLAVQILLAPISIYYFHSFPLDFLINNLIAVPLASICLYLTILCLNLSLIFEPLAMAVTPVLQSILTLGLFIIENLHITELTLNDLWPHPLSVASYLFGALCLVPAQVSRRTRFSFFLFAMWIAICTNYYHLKEIRRGQALIAYDQPQLGRIGIRNGPHVKVLPKQDQSSFHKMAFESVSSGPFGQVETLDQINFMTCIDQRDVLVLTQTIELKDEVTPDVVILRDASAIPSLYGLQLSPCLLVVACRSSDTALHELECWCSENDCVLWSIKDQGYWMIKAEHDEDQD